MTKLMEWIFGLIIFLATWLLLLNGYSKESVVDSTYYHILLLPIYAVLCFGLCSVSVIVYRVYSFNDCADAADSLRKEIIEANEDLKRKGFKFND